MQSDYEYYAYPYYISFIMPIEVSGSNRYKIEPINHTTFRTFRAGFWVALEILNYLGNIFKYKVLKLDERLGGG